MAVDDNKDCTLLGNRVEISTALLSLFAHRTSRRDYLDAVVQLLRTATGCECAGIRILDEDGYVPYESYQGFSREFWLSENQLLAGRDQCACTRVLLDRPERQDAAAMTAGGSFVTNNAVSFVGSLTAEECSRFRGVCVRSGFLSIAVVPIRYDDRVLGLVHLADRRAGALPHDLVQRAEAAGPLIGAAVNRFNLEDELRRNYDFKEVVNELLGLSLRDMSLEQLLERAIEIITSIPWLSLESKGCIFLKAAKGDQLILTAQRGMAAPVLDQCRCLALGSCLCGTAAASGELQVATEVDARHTIRPEGIGSHGHYVVPLLSGDRVLGVMNLYVQANRHASAKKQASLRTIADILAGLIERKRAQEQLRLLASELSLTEARERRALSADLHDSIAQVLAITKFKLHALRSAMPSVALGKDVDELTDLIGSAILQTRHLMFELSPAMLYESGLEVALEGLANRMRELHGIAIEVERTGALPTLGDDVRAVLFRAVRELVLNTVKHARARQIKISMASGDGVIRIRVCDDGVGFDVGRELAGGHGGGHFGLLNVHERLHDMGGQVEIASQPGSGTTVTLVMPGT